MQNQLKSIILFLYWAGKITHHLRDSLAESFASVFRWWFSQCAGMHVGHSSISAHKNPVSQSSVWCYGYRAAAENSGALPEMLRHIDPSIFPGQPKSMAGRTNTISHGEAENVMQHECFWQQTHISSSSACGSKGSRIWPLTTSSFLLYSPDSRIHLPVNVRASIA